jgi:hypothetical protein
MTCCTWEKINHKVCEESRTGECIQISSRYNQPDNQCVSRRIKGTSYVPISTSLNKTRSTMDEFSKVKPTLEAMWSAWRVVSFARICRHAFALCLKLIRYNFLSPVMVETWVGLLSWARYAHHLHRSEAWYCWCVFDFLDNLVLSVGF